MKQEVHLREQIWQWFRSPAKDAALLQHLSILNSFALLFQMLKRLDEKPASAASRIKNCFTEFRIGHNHHEPNNWAWCVEFTGVASRIAHFAQHCFVKRAERVYFFARSE